MTQVKYWEKCWNKIRLSQFRLRKRLKRNKFSRVTVCAFIWTNWFITRSEAIASLTYKSISTLIVWHTFWTTDFFINKTILTKWAVFVSFASSMACMLITFFTVLTVVVINTTHLAFFFEAYFGMGTMIIINTIFLA